MADKFIKEQSETFCRTLEAGELALKEQTREVLTPSPSPWYRLFLPADVLE